MANYIYVKDEKVVMWALGYICKYTGYKNSVTGRLEGRGTLAFGNGDKFEGTFMDGHPVTGKYTYFNGCFVTITYKYNKLKNSYDRSFDTARESFGYPSIVWTASEEYSNGYYNGDMKDGMRHGRGSYYFNAGGCFSGGWKNNKQHGIIRTIYANGNDDWSLYEDGERIATLREYISIKNRPQPVPAKVETPSRQESSYIDSDTSDYDYSSDSSDDDSESDLDRMKDDLFDKALHEINYGTKESALDALNRLRSFSDSDDYYFEDTLGNQIDIDEQIEEVEEWDDDEDSDESTSM